MVHMGDIPITECQMCSDAGCGNKNQNLHPWCDRVITCPNTHQIWTIKQGGKCFLETLLGGTRPPPRSTNLKKISNSTSTPKSTFAVGSLLYSQAGSKRDCKAVAADTENRSKTTNDGYSQGPHKGSSQNPGLGWHSKSNKKKLNPAGCVLNRNHEHGPKPLKHTPTIFDNQIRKF